MNSRKNSFKRVAASALAVLTVAAYAAPVANVGGLPSANILTSEAAAADTMVTFGTAANYITNATDGTNTATAAQISSSWQREFANETVLTITSKVPLIFNAKAQDDGTGTYTNSVGGQALPYTTNLLEKENGAFKYQNNYLVNESNGTYYYKVLVTENLHINGETTTVGLVNTTGETVTRTDGSVVKLTALTNVKVNGKATIPAEGLVKKSTAKIESDKSFEIYVKDNTNGAAPLVQATAKYVDGKFVAEAPIPATTTDVNNGNNVTIYINKVAPNYSYSNKGTYLLATATNAPQVNAASITATYEQKIKKTKDELAADIAAYKQKYNVSDEDAAAAVSVYKYDTPSDIVTGASVSNESRVVLTFKNDSTGEITSYQDDTNSNQFYTLKITKDGKEFEDNVLPFANDAVYPAGNANTTYGNVKKDPDLTNAPLYYVPGADSTGESKLAFTATGVYKVEYTVYTKTTATNGTVTYKPETLIFNFTIATKPLLKENNVRLTANAPEVAVPNTNPVEYTMPALNGGQAIKKVGIVNGVVQIEVSEDWTKNDIITVTPELFAEVDDAANFTGKTAAAAGLEAGGATKGAPKSIVGTASSSTLDKVNELTIIYSNNEYSAVDESVKVKWKLVEAKKAVKIAPYDGATTGWNDGNQNTAYFTTTVDDLDTFVDDLFDTLDIENADIDDIQLEYVKEFGTTGNTNVLNYHVEGIPSESGKYSLFFVYEDEVIAACNVEIAEHALYAAPTSKQLSYTYGTKALTCDDLAFVDAESNKIEDANVTGAVIKYFPTRELKKSEIKKITDKDTFFDTVANKYVDVYTVGDTKYIVDANKAAVDPYDAQYAGVNGYLNAGVYLVSISKDTNNNNTKVGKKGYTLIGKSFVVNVAKKKLKASMISFDPSIYDGGTKTPANMKIVDTAVKDNSVANKNGYDLTGEASVSGGTTSAKDIGANTVDVQINVENSNYTGTVSAKWYIIKEAKQDLMNGLKFTDERTTIYDNGQIHFEITRPDNTQFAEGVAKYGVIIDKSGKIPAPEKVNGLYPRHSVYNPNTEKYDNATFEAAHKALQVGNGFKEGNQSDIQKNGKTPLVYGANIAITDVDTGAWFRPYVIDGKGEIYYGEVIYVNLVQEATEALKLTMANAVNPLDKTATSGRNTTVVTKDEAKADQSATVLANKTWREQVQSGFDKRENTYYVYGSYTLEGNELVKNSAVQAFGVVVDKTGAFDTNGILVSDGTTTVEDGLVLGKGFIQGYGGSNKMELDEYGAVIIPSNNVTGVWVRAYVNLGKSKSSNKELVVYTDPVYITDISTYYYAADNITATKYSQNAQNANAYDVEFTANATVGNLKGATVKRTGLIVETTGKFIEVDQSGDYSATGTLTAENKAKANAEMLLGKGFLQGKKESANYNSAVSYNTYNHSGTNTITPIPIVVRPYAIYTVNGVDITIYGDAQIPTAKANP